MHVCYVDGIPRALQLYHTQTSSNFPLLLCACFGCAAGSASDASVAAAAAAPSTIPAAVPTAASMGMSVSVK